jgi:hypothetical protein
MADIETHTLLHILGGIQLLIALLREGNGLIHLRSLSAKLILCMLSFSVLKPGQTPRQ